MKHRFYGLLALTGLALLGGCVQLPAGIEPVTPFDADRYLGRWYEVARLDHRFERGLSQVSADYSRTDNDEIKVINRGCDAQSGSWQQAEGRARFVDDPNTGYLKVSFFGPFYGTYAIFELDPDYQYAFVSGPDRDYLWLLSRDPQPDAALRQHFVKRAGELGFAVDDLIWVKQGDSRCD